MKKIFIDAGAHNGCSVKKFRKEHDINNEYLIYSFEPNPIFSKCFDNISNHIFINKAVWIEDGKKEFYKSKAELHDGSTLIKEKKTGKLDKENPIIVETIDFSKWIFDNFSIKDYIILKMDIEGAEYPVISKMIKDGSFAYINKLWIEWHMSKIGLSEEKHKNLVNKISIPIRKWDALKCAH